MYLQKRIEIARVIKDVEKRDPLYTVDRNIIHEPTVENKHTKKECGKKIKETEAEIIQVKRGRERGA